jgi:hypothetical protein
MMAQLHSGCDPAALVNVRGLAEALGAEGRTSDAVMLLEFLAALESGNVETLRPLVRLLGAAGRTVEALERLCEVKAASADMDALIASVNEQLPAALECFNGLLAAGSVAEAEKVVAAMVALIPRHKALVEAALNCNAALGRHEQVSRYTAMLSALDDRVPAQQASPPPADPQEHAHAHPLIRLRDIHDAISTLLCAPLTGDSVRRLEALLQAGRGLAVPVPPGSEWEDWEKHYRLMLDAIDLWAVQGATPAPRAVPETAFATSDGKPASWLALSAAAARLGAEAVFFAAADQAYIDLYARWYITSILENCDVPCLVVVHVIGGADRLPSVAKALGLRDERLFFSGDRFDGGAVTTACFDAPPKGKSEKPVAHFQSIRFLRLAPLLQTLKRPVFVSDIDLVLQQGVKDLLDRTAGADIVLNQNDASIHAGSRITANLLLVNPTGNAGLYLDFVGGFLEKQLNKPAVSRWIDQLALHMALHHLMLRGARPQIAYFDTGRDINNVMYPSYRDNPFRFLSLFHGFDMSSLERGGKTALETPPRRTAKRRARRASR